MTLIPVMAQPDVIQQSTAIQSSAQNATQTNSNSDSMAKKRYYCPMHPEVISNEPGKCPKCEMDLVPMPAAAK
jgi:hypothetical protein